MQIDADVVEAARDHLPMGILDRMFTHSLLVHMLRWYYVSLPATGEPATIQLANRVQKAMRNQHWRTLFTEVA